MLEYMSNIFLEIDAIILVLQKKTRESDDRHGKDTN